MRLEEETAHLLTLLFPWLKGKDEYLLGLFCVLTIKYLI